MEDKREFYTLNLRHGSLENLSEETFMQFQQALSKFLKESGAAEVTISRDSLQNRALMIDHVVGP